ncbi:MAG: hypothetical protein V3U37_06055 [Nitrospinaceae bacterium]
MKYCKKNRRPGPAYFLLVILLFLVSGCFNPELEKAFQGGFAADRGNQIIGDYCQGCHIHKDFDPDAHVTEARGSYRRPYFRRATECRSCHFIEKQWIHNQFTRKTRMPKDANRGRYRDFEKKELSKKRKS